MKQVVGFTSLSKLGTRGYVAQCFPLSSLDLGGEVFLGESIQNKHNFLWNHLGTTGIGGWTGRWMEGRKESHGFQTVVSHLLFMTTGTSSDLLE